MKVFASICLSLILCQLGDTSIIPGQVEKEPLGNIIHYNSGLKSVSPVSSDSSLLTSCNGVLNTTSGGIAYRAFEPIGENERCVWTIRGGRANGFSLNVLNLGISNSSTGTQVVATCLLKGQNMANHILLNQTGPVNGVSYCNMLVITFASGRDVSDSTGFVLEYSILRSGSISTQSQDYIIEAGTTGIIRHPISASRYENYELNTFVMLPTLGSNTNVIYFRGSLEENCYDKLSVYRFNASSVAPTKWEYKGRICAHILSEFISNGDLILITFDSDSSGVGAGFQLAIAPSDSSQCSN